MGNFLDTPITEKETEVGEDESKGVCYGCAHGDSGRAAPWRWPLPTPSHPDLTRRPWRRLSAMQGWRSHMEDDHIHMLTLSPELPHLSLFGIFDGHGVCRLPG